MYITLGTIKAVVPYEPH